MFTIYKYTYTHNTYISIPHCISIRQTIIYVYKSIQLYTHIMYNLNDSMTALRKSVCVPFAKNKVEPDDKSLIATSVPRLRFHFSNQIEAFSSNNPKYFCQKLRIKWPTASRQHVGLTWRTCMHFPIFHSCSNKKSLYQSCLAPRRLLIKLFFSYSTGPRLFSSS